MLEDLPFTKAEQVSRALPRHPLLPRVTTMLEASSGATKACQKVGGRCHSTDTHVGWKGCLPVYWLPRSVSVLSVSERRTPPEAEHKAEANSIQQAGLRDGLPTPPVLLSLAVCPRTGHAGL